MKILGIETSCDETAVCILEANGGLDKPVFNVLGNALYSQIDIHKEYGGVFPAVAKREHAKNLVPLLIKALKEAELLKPTPSAAADTPPETGGVRGGIHKKLEEKLENGLKKILEREPGLFEQTKKFLETYEKPEIDTIAVTAGPGLEPALWVGINFAHALSEAWIIPVIPTNHMEGHVVSALKTGEKIDFPALALLISGGHTELVLMNNWLEYKVIGQTRDDAVGEAFDKVARLLGLPYPGGPEISKLAQEAREKNIMSEYSLPRPMINSGDFSFSFSGIKTAVLYTLKKIPEITHDIKLQIALEFENAVTEVLVAKVKKALEAYDIKTLILGGGVVANKYIRQAFQNLIEQEFSNTKLLIPEFSLATDNAVMIAMAAYINMSAGKKLDNILLKAEGNLKLS